jgi:hypothetical protein
MKKLFLLIAIVACSVLVGCASPNAVAVFCADVAPFNALVATIPNVSPKVTQDIADAKPIVDTVCANPSTLEAASLQTLLSTGFPLVLDIAAAIQPQTPETALIITDVQIASMAIPAMIAAAKPITVTVSK